MDYIQFRNIFIITSADIEQGYLSAHSPLLSL